MNSDYGIAIDCRCDDQETATGRCGSERMQCESEEKGRVECCRRYSVLVVGGRGRGWGGGGWV